MSLSFDGKGINGPDKYKSRLATFTSDEAAKKYGVLFAAAPELLESLQRLVKASNQSEPDPIVMFATIEQARHIIAKATGAPV